MLFFFLHAYRDDLVQHEQRVVGCGTEILADHLLVFLRERFEDLDEAVSPQSAKEVVPVYFVLPLTEYQ